VTVKSLENIALLFICKYFQCCC